MDLAAKRARLWYQTEHYLPFLTIKAGVSVNQIKSEAKQSEPTNIHLVRWKCRKAKKILVQNYDVDKPNYKARYEMHPRDSGENFMGTTMENR